jgi:DNA polymerase-3 subunit alpha
MQRACDLIRQRHGLIYTINTIPTDEPETYDFISSGRTAGVFQLEGSGMTRFIVQMKPKSLAHVIAMVALYRPGPLDFIPSYIRRMHGEEPVTYRHPAMEPIFSETYGIPIYQEQIMFAAMQMAGYTASEADDLRKAIAKKKADVLLKHREKFISGAQAKGIDEDTAMQVFDDWENFARYGFPKAHAADYGVIAVQTAYLKAHYTVEFMTALLTASKNETEKIALYTAECRSMGVEVLPPDINASRWDFTIEDRPGEKAAVRFGLGAVKNVGQGAVELILQARQNGLFADLNDLAHRVDLRAVGKRALECLIKVGALDQFGQRQAMLLALEQIVSISSSHFRALESGQLSLFGAMVSQMENIRLPKVANVDPREGLTWERELIGMYLSSHPLGPYVPLLKRRVTHFAGQLGDTRHKEKIVVGGMISRMRPHLTKTGKSMGFITLEDIQGFIEVVVFPRTWEACCTQLEQDVVVLVEGSADNEGGSEPKVLADKVTVLSTADAEAAAKLPMPQKTVYQAPPPTGEDEVIVPESKAAAPWGDPGMPPPPENFEGDEWFPQVEAVNDTRHAVEVAETPAPKPEPIAPVTDVPKNPQPSLEESPVRAMVLPVIPPVLEPGISAEESEQPSKVPLYVLPPAPKGLIAESIDDDRPHLVTVTLNPTGDRERDVRRMRRIHGALVSCPGNDRFAFQLFENGRFYLLEFPNSTTGLSNDLISRLIHLAGEGNVRVDIVNIQ